mmetsp:Transcript_88979/g.157540  ORF Transcript_88979/g.157540 Transcript_88979/m.157540 type:complete len:81 (+) Transcript_88979:79-321(+)
MQNPSLVQLQKDPWPKGSNEAVLHELCLNKIPPKRYFECEGAEPPRSRKCAKLTSSVLCTQNRIMQAEVGHWPPQAFCNH